MRIVGGESRGRRLKSLRARSVRPTCARAREALFDMLGARAQGSRFLDLFAGVGAIGLEALSRGARQVVLVESSERAAKVIRGNADALGHPERVSVVRAKAAAAVRGLEAAGAKFDIVFMDPPYREREELMRTLAEVAREGGILTSDAVVVVEHDAHAGGLETPEALAVERSRRFGDSALTFFRPRRSRERADGDSGLSGQL